MVGNRDNRRMAFAGCASVLAHLLVGAAIVGISSGASVDSLKGLDPDTLPQPEPPHDPNRPTDVGNPESNATTLTWIGYEQYLEHASPRTSDVEQPQVQIEPSGMLADRGAGDAPEVTEQAPPQPVEAPQPVADATQTEDAPERHAQAVNTPEVSPTQEVAHIEPVVPASEPEHVGPPAAIAVAADETELEAAEPVQPVAAPPAPTREEPVETVEPVQPLLQPPEAAQPSPPAAVPPRPAGDHTVGDDTGAAEDRDGRKDTRDADFAAVRQAERVKLGQPVAAKGLRINTVRPRGTHYDSIMARYSDPVVRVFFDRDGVVRDVRFLRRSMHSDVDRYVLNAVYQWRAEGEELLKLPVSDPDEKPRTVYVDFVIVRPLSG